MANGSYSLKGGSLTANDNYMFVGDAGTGTFTQSGGTNSAGSLNLGAGTRSVGTYNLNGGELIVDSIPKLSGTAAFNFGGGTLQASAAFSTALPMTLTGSGGNANVDTTSGAVTFAGQLSGSGGLNKIGGGALTLTGNNSYTGTTTVSCGTFKADNSAGSATGSGPVMVNAGATLSGSGIIGGPLEIAGELGPGDSPEILTVNNQVTFQPGSALNAVVSGTAAGSGYDQLTTTGPVSLAGSLNVTFGAFTPNDNDILILINNSGALSGTFQYADKAEIGTFDGFNWYITYEASDSGAPSLSGGNDVAIYTQAVPEPATLTLLAAGAIGLAAGMWRRKKCGARASRTGEPAPLQPSP